MVAAFKMSFRIADSEASRSIPWSSPNEFAEMKSPRQTRVAGLAADLDRPELVKSERDVVAAARIIESVGELRAAAGHRAVCRKRRG